MKRNEFVSQQIEEILDFVRKFNSEQNNTPLPEKLETGIKLRITNLVLEAENIAKNECRAQETRAYNDRMGIRREYPD